MNVKIVIPIYALACGAVSAFLYALLHRHLIYGVTAIFLPYFGVAYAGLAYGRAGLNAAIGVALPLLLLLLPWQDTVIIALTQIIPLNLLIRCLMMAAFRENPPTLIWSPPCYAVSYTCLYGAIFFALAIITQGALYEYMSAPIVAMLGRAADDLQLKNFVNYVYLLIGVDFCLNLLNIIIVVFLLHRLLRHSGANRRPALFFASPHNPPDIMLVVAAFALFVAAIGDANISKAGECALLILLVPYLYSGFSNIHFAIYLTRDKKIWFGLFYIALIALNATALLMITIYGISTHISRTSLRLKSK